MYDFTDTTEARLRPGLPPEALKLNGEYIEDLVEGYRTLYTVGREFLSPETDTFETGTRDGSTLKSRRYPERTITVGYQLVTESPEAFREAYNRLSFLLSKPESELVFEDEPDYYFTGTATDFGEVEPGRNAVRGEISFLCTDPFKYSVVEYEAEAQPEDPSVIFVDYGGNYKSFPVLEADFFREEETSEDGETVETLTGNGDCGYVAFFNGDEKIIQLGDPEEEDGETAYARSQTLVNQTWQSESAWGTAAKSLWTVNAGEVLPEGTLQTGSVGMKVASYAVPSSPKDTSGTLLKSRATTQGAPIFYYTVTAKTSRRTANSVKVDVAVTTSLKYATSYFGRGYGLKGHLYIGGAWREFVIKQTTAYWKGKTGHTVNLSFTVTGLGSTTAALTGIKFKTTRLDSTPGAVTGVLKETACSNLSVSQYVADVPETWYLSAAGYGSAAGKYHGPSLTRILPADEAGETGAENFILTYKQKMCIGNGAGDINQLGAFQVQVTDENGKGIAGVRIRKGKAGKTATVEYYVSGKQIKTEDTDLAYNNPDFGSLEASVKASSIEKTGNKVTFTVGGQKHTFTEDTVKEARAVKVTFMFEQYGSSAALSYNGLYWMKFVKTNCNTFKDIPNKFSASDVLEADCRTGEIYLNGIKSPALGALGNDWEEFYLKQGLNQIGVAWSEWIPEGYEPSFKVRYREVFL